MQPRVNGQDWGFWDREFGTAAERGHTAGIQPGLEPSTADYRKRTSGPESYVSSDILWKIAGCKLLQKYLVNIWAGTWENLQNCMWIQPRPISACTFAIINLGFLHEEALDPWLPIGHPVRTDQTGGMDRLIKSLFLVVCDFVDFVMLWLIL